MLAVTGILDSLYTTRMEPEDVARVPSYNRWQVVLQQGQGQVLRNVVLPKLPYTEPWQIADTPGDELAQRLGPWAPAFAFYLGDDWQRGGEDIARLNSAKAVGFSITNARLLPEGFRRAIGLKYEEGRDGKGGKYFVSNPRVYTLVQRLPLWASLQAYLRVMVQPEGEVGDDTGVPVRMLGAAAGLRAPLAKSPEAIQQMREIRFQKTLEELSVTGRYAFPSVRLRRDSGVSDFPGDEGAGEPPEAGDGVEE